MLFYSASFFEDMREVVAHVGARYPKVNLYAVGCSLGGKNSRSLFGSGKITIQLPFMSLFWSR